VTAVLTAESKNMYPENMISREKVPAAGFEPATFCLRVTTRTLSAMVFKGILLTFSLYLHLQLAVESK